MRGFTDISRSGGGTAAPTIDCELKGLHGGRQYRVAWLPTDERSVRFEAHVTPLYSLEIVNFSFFVFFFLLDITTQLEI